jgi:hypothetical protein
MEVNGCLLVLANTHTHAHTREQPWQCHEQRDSHLHHGSEKNCEHLDKIPASYLPIKTRRRLYCTTMFSNYIIDEGSRSEDHV